MAVTLVLGGTRSGKSAAAEAIALACPGPVTYIATGSSTDDLGVTDDDMARRIADHQRARNVRFVTLEAGRELVDAVAGCDGPVLVDSLGTWVAATWSAESAAFTPDVDALVAALVERTAATVVVSDEVGLSVHPESEAGRRFRDTLGTVNRAVAEVADEVWLVVAGRGLRLDRLPLRAHDESREP